MILDDVAKPQADGTAEVAHGIGAEQPVESVFDAPEQGCGEHAHDGVKGKELAVVPEAVCLKAEDMALVENVFDQQTDSGAGQNGNLDGVSVVVHPDGQGLGPQVGGRSQGGEECVEHANAGDVLHATNLASPNAAKKQAATSQLTRSFRAKTMGSSCIWPRCAISQALEIQNKSKGQASQMNLGVA